MTTKDFSIFLYDLRMLPEGHTLRRKLSRSPNLPWDSMFIMDGRVSFEPGASREAALRHTLNSIRWRSIIGPFDSGVLRKEDILPWWDSEACTRVSVEGNHVIDAVFREPLVSRYEIQVSQFDCETPVHGLLFEDDSTEVERLQKAFRRSVRLFAFFMSSYAKKSCEVHLRQWADLVWEKHEIYFGLPSNSGFGDEFREVVLTPENLLKAKDSKICPFCPPHDERIAGDQV